eukprot:gene30324-35316_t
MPPDASKMPCHEAPPESRTQNATRVRASGAPYRPKRSSKPGGHTTNVDDVASYLVNHAERGIGAVSGKSGNSNGTGSDQTRKKSCKSISGGHHFLRPSF